MFGKIAITVCVTLFISNLVLAQNATELKDESKRLLNDLKEKITDTLAQVKTIEEAGREEDASLLDIDNVLSSPATRLTNLGLVLDVTGEGDYLAVLGVTPNSIAERMGISPGDKLFAIDDIKTTPSNLEQLSHFLNNLVDQQTIRLDLITSGVRKTLAAEVSVTTIPAFTLKLDHPIGECGRFALLKQPQLDRKTFPLELMKIDNKNEKRVINSLSEIERYKSKYYNLKPGPHILLVKSELAARHLKKRPYYKSRYEKKEITLDIKPNVDYLLAAEIVDQEWEIKVISTKRYNCEFKWFD